jgi:hypothetical protein
VSAVLSLLVSLNWRTTIFSHVDLGERAVVPVAELEPVAAEQARDRVVPVVSPDSLRVAAPR